MLHQAIPSLSEPHPTTTASFPAYVVEKVVVGRQMGEMVGPYVTGEISVMIAMSLYYPTNFFRIQVSNWEQELVERKL